MDWWLSGYKVQIYMAALRHKSYHVDGETGRSSIAIYSKEVQPVEDSKGGIFLYCGLWTKFYV